MIPVIKRCVTELRFKDTNRLKVRTWKKYTLCKQQPKKAGLAIMVSNTRVKHFARDKNQISYNDKKIKPWGSHNNYK